MEAAALECAGCSLSVTNSVCAGQFKPPFVLGGRSYLDLESPSNSFWLLPTHIGLLLCLCGWKRYPPPSSCPQGFGAQSLKAGMRKPIHALGGFVKGERKELNRGSGPALSIST